MHNTFNLKQISKSDHHVKHEVCSSRASYREGRKATAVKVYTINQESYYLLIFGVPAVGAAQELLYECEQFGHVNRFSPLDEYPAEEYTEVYLVMYLNLQDARNAKKRLDDRSFFGGSIHVCYAPEFESVQDTRNKLLERRKIVSAKTRHFTGEKVQSGNDGTILSLKEGSSSSSQHERALSTSSTVPKQQPTTYIWAGKEYTVNSADDNLITPSSSSQPETVKQSSLLLPRCVREQKSFRTDYHGSTSTDVESHSKSKVPKLTQTMNLKEPEQFYSSSYDDTVASIRKKLSSVSTPVRPVNLKHKK
ncbi:uncharacterized protein LOC143234304 [Tachypleus tridentatus]|uniref:uncharacterized protein LOC143234304 n=1 Tax=Tachypleus tridentatus TaxID=6853 RepID=UPI003FD35E13